MRSKTERPAVSFWDLVLFCTIAAAPTALLAGLSLWLSIWVMRTHLGWGG